MDIFSALSLVGLDDLYGKKFSEEQVDILALSMMTESDFRDLEVLEEHVPLLINLSADIKASMGSNASASLEKNSREWHKHRNTSEQHLIGVEAFVFRLQSGDFLSVAHRTSGGIRALRGVVGTQRYHNTLNC